MATTNSLGLIYEISADPSKAEASQAEFEKTIAATYERAAGSTEPFNKSLLTSRESARLLSEEFGLHLPRAVTSAMAEIMPAISAVGPAMLAAFAVAELPKLIAGIHNATDALGGFGKEAKEAFAAAVKASDEAMTHFRTIKDGISLRKEINQNIAALSVQRDALDATGGSAINYAKGVLELLQGHVAQASLYVGLARAEQVDASKLAGLEKTRAEQLNREIQLQGQVAHEVAETVDRYRNATEAGKNLEQVYEAMWASQKAGTRIMLEAAKAVNEYEKGLAKSEATARAVAKIQDQLTVLELKDLTVLMQELSPLTRAEEETKHLSAARKELLGITQDLHHVEDAFTQALKGERAALDSDLEGAEQTAEAIAAMTGSTKDVAYVRGGYDAAKAIECMAAFIESWGTDVAQFEASIQWAAAAEQQFKVAGKGSAGGARAGGGTAGRVGGSSGPQAAGAMGSQVPMGPGLTPMGGGTAVGGGNLTVYVYGSNQEATHIAGVLNDYTQRQGGRVVASDTINPPKAGR